MMHEESTDHSPPPPHFISTGLPPQSAFGRDRLPQQKMNIENNWVNGLERGLSFEESEDRLEFVRKVFGIISA